MEKHFADGSFLYFHTTDEDEFFIQCNYKKSTKNIHHKANSFHKIDVTFEQMNKDVPDPVSLDVLFIFDTTGSMQEEINRLKNTIDIINRNIEAFSPAPQVRFGMVLYKDKQDQYDTKMIPFTSDLDKFQRELDNVNAQGGGDYPEDLQAALQVAIQKMKWNENGIRLGFIITDAPPHLYKDQDYTYIDAAKDAKEKAVKIFSIGTGGLDINGEYVLRQLSQYTSAKYVFLTYGEKGESEGGRPGSVSHHTGENFNTEKLDVIIIQFVKEELKSFNDIEVEIKDEYFIATKIDNEKSEITLESLFTQAFSQLVDYSTIKLDHNVPTAISPLLSNSSSCAVNAEYFYDHMMLALASNETFLATERKDLQPVLDELKFQLDELSDDENAAELGKFLGADLLISGKLYKKNDHYEIIIKLMNVETIEILSITKVRIDKDLGL